MTAEDGVQVAVDNAFAWVHRVYRESRALLGEATELLRQHGLDHWDKNPEALFGNDTAYLLAKYFSTQKQMEAERGVDVFVGVSLYPDARYRRGTGASLVAGISKRSRAEISYMGKVVNFAARAPATSDLFRIVSAPDDPVVVCIPEDAARRDYAGIDEVRSVAMPLTRFRSSSDLETLIAALVAMRMDNEAPLRVLLAADAGGSA